MFARIRITAAFICIGIGAGIVPQFSLASSPNPGRDLLSFFRPSHAPVATSEVPSNVAAAVSHHRLARHFAERNDVERANANFSLALQHAAPRQVAGIAADYAAFLIDVGDLHRAELMLRQALSQSPNDREVIRMLARCLVRQNKMAEGLRHFRTIGTEAEARAEIAAIYREQGNTDMLAAVEQRWGSTELETTRPEPASLIAATPRPPVATASPEEATPEPHVALTPRPATAPPLPGATQPGAVQPHTARTLPVASTVVAATSAAPPLSTSGLSENRVPIPIPRSAPLPAPVAQSTPERLVLTNTVRLTGAPMPNASPARTEMEAREPARPAVTIQPIIQPRRHYVVNVRTSADLETLLPIVQPAAATVIMRDSR